MRTDKEFEIAHFSTPKALHNKAQGRERSERTLGFEPAQNSTLKGLHKARRVRPLQGRLEKNVC